VDKQYEEYCLADAVFYDVPRHDDPQAGFPVTRRPLPGGWRRARRGDWMVFVPPGSPLPSQGWKIHAAACPDNAARTLTRIWEYCVPREIYFKVISTPVGLLMRNMKYAPRSASGKAAAIYPPDAQSCERILRELDAELAGAAGPCILSDLRYGQGPLHVRYGGFAERFCLDGDGARVPAIENADGDLVPDVRSPVFRMPDWVGLPEFLAPHLAARNSVAISDLPCEVTGALHFSNGGGVYAAIDKRDGAKVVLKEARPHAGLAADGSDAVARLRREHDLMRRLSGLGIAPEARGFFQAGEHHFLMAEFIEGQSLNSAIAGRFPLAPPDPDPGELADYASWAVRVCSATERAAELMHARGIVFNDLHTGNIIVRPDETVAFIDFEAASDTGEGRRVTVANPGFAAPRDRTGFEVDAYSLACIRLSVFMPLTTLLPLDRPKAAQIAAEIAAIYPVPAGFLEEAVAEITRGARPPAAGDLTAAFASAAATRPVIAPQPAAPLPRRAPGGGPDEAAWQRLSGSLVTAIRASATPARRDRLFPGDVDQFRIPGGGITLAYGAAGVLYALAEAAGVRVTDYEEWLLRRAADPPAGIPLGCYDGLAGVAWTLGRLGHREAAVRLAQMCVEASWERLGHGLFDGLAGFGLAMLGLAESAAEPGLAAAGVRAAEIVACAAGGHDGPAGLMHGPSGKALLFVRAYERTGDGGYLDAAAAAIAADLGKCVADRFGGLQVDEGWRVLPYVKGGSAGIGMVIGELQAHRRDPAFAAAADSIAVCAASPFFAQSGLLSGRAGLLCFLAGRDRAAARVSDHVRRLAWHAVPYRGGLAFPGDMLFRLAMDLGTGTAGVLLGLATALAPGGACLPFFARPACLPERDPVRTGLAQGANQDKARR
jgi:tRNA A-37 threonylcarbamoyl transferase component Bud32